MRATSSKMQTRLNNGTILDSRNLMRNFMNPSQPLWVISIWFLPLKITIITSRIVMKKCKCWSLSYNRRRLSSHSSRMNYQTKIVISLAWIFKTNSCYKNWNTPKNNYDRETQRWKSSVKWWNNMKLDCKKQNKGRDKKMLKSKKW